MLAVALVGAGVSLWRAWPNRVIDGHVNLPAFDFHHFYLDAAYVWEHGRLNPDLDGPDRLSQRQLPFYLPVVSLALAPIAAFGPHLAAGLWACGQGAAVWVSLSILWGWLARRPMEAAERVRRFLILLLISAPAIFEALRFNQLSFFVLALGLLAFETARRGAVRAALFVAGAATLKLLPALLGLWLVATRRWWSAALSGVFAIVLAVVPCLIMWGPAETLRAHREWLAHNTQGGAAGGLADTRGFDHFHDHRNQSFTAVAARWLALDHPARGGLPVTGGLSMRAALRIGQALTLLALVGALAAMWRLGARRGGLALIDQRIFAAAMLLAIALAPLLRQYYLVWAMPALFAIAAESRGGRLARSGLVMLVIWSAGMLCWLSPTMRAAGAHLAMSLGMLAVLLTRPPTDASADELPFEAPQDDAGVVAAEAERV